MIAVRSILLVFWFLWLVFYPGISFAQSERAKPEPIDEVSSCLQYSPAKNPQTGECKDFACTPIPQEWVKVDKCNAQEQISIPIQIKIPKLELRLPAAAEQPSPEGKITEISSEPEILKENREIQIKLKTAPQVVSEELSVSASKAVQAAIREKIVDLLKEAVITKGEAKEPLFELELLGNGEEAVYKIKGVKQKRLFGLIPVIIKKDVFMSAKSGKVINEQLTFFSRLLEKLSF